MALLPIIIAPDPRLKVTANPWTQAYEGRAKTEGTHQATRHDARGSGLGPPQVGVKRRVIVIDTAGWDEAPDPLQMANPELVWVSGEMQNQEEGCLSLPEHYAEVERHDAIRVRYLDYGGEISEREVGGWLATCIQHEMDHLDGILFVDRISFLKRKMILRKLSKAKKLAAAPA